MPASTASVSQEEVIAFLESPQTYGADEPVERIDTHAAIVFLAGDRAYKLKRAVRYSYLDFSTADKRKLVCETELALNRRTAPELYLEVCSVNRLADGSLGFAKGEPVDWLIVMRRFKANDLLEAVAARGRLNFALVRELADEIARFHGHAAIVSCEDAAERIRRVIEGNRLSMARLPESALSPGDCNDLYERSCAELGRVGPILDRRGRSGHVRHCHGDLHLANICLWHEKPTLFDCLEFDDDLAITDVLYDLSFLIMDLYEKGYRAQASQLFNRYLDMRDESDGVAAFPLFLSLRASVRAHVTAIAADRQKTAAERLNKLADARDFLAAAKSFLDPTEPQLVVIGGFSGTGKSTLASALAPKLAGAPGARWLRTDVLRKRLAGVKPETALPPEAYTPQHNMEVYDRLLAEAAGMLAAGRSAIVDGVFADLAERTKITEVASAAKVGFLGLWLEASPERLFNRVSARKGDASDADQHVVERQLNYDPGNLDGWIRIDANGAPNEVMSAAFRHLK